MTGTATPDRLSLTTRRALGLLLAAAWIAYWLLLWATYLQFTSASSLAPNLTEIAMLLDREARPVSRLERLLESREGEMNRGGSMRPAFTDQSADWELLTRPLDDAARAKLLAEREGERLALLDWVRSGGSAMAYEQDDYLLKAPEAISRITAKYCIPGEAAEETTPARVRIRALITDRCVSCHGPDGRHDTARFIELNSYERLATHLTPEGRQQPQRRWLVAALGGLYPLSMLTSALCLLSRQPLVVRWALAGITLGALFTLTAAWFAGPTAAPGLLAAASIGGLTAFLQAVAVLHELMNPPSAPEGGRESVRLGKKRA